MADHAPSPVGRLRQRLQLSHVQLRSDEQLRARWQRRLDSGERISCWRCRRRGELTPVDPRDWYVREDMRTPECSACHARTQEIVDAGPGGL